MRAQTLVESVQTPLAGLATLLHPELDCESAVLEIQWEHGECQRIPLPGANPEQLRFPGYHRLRIEANLKGESRRLSAELHWILCPDRCRTPNPDRPLNGINCFLPSLRSSRNWGCGDLTDLTDFAAALNQRTTFDFVALNPLHAIHNRAPYNTSPYLPLSIFTRNFLYLDIESIAEYQRCSWIRTLVGSGAFQKQLEDLRGAEFVNYEQVARIKQFVLWVLFREYLRSRHEAGEDELEEYRSDKGQWLDAYCTYMAFDRYFHRRNGDAWHWRQWPEEYQRPDSDASKALARRLRRAIEFHAWVQMRLDEQIARAHSRLLQSGYRLGLYQDLALATDRVGADYWAYQELFAPQVRVGSPPDDFNEGGQDWGFPALHPQRHCDSGYKYFVESIRCSAEHAGAIRLDHVMRLARLYWIPDGVSARDGAYVRDRFQDLLRILALESQRGNFIVVGEDLGTVPEYFRKALDEFGILSYRLILFERDGDAFRPPDHFPKQAIAAFTTHDLPTFDGWLRGSDLMARVEAGQLPPGELDSGFASRRSAIEHLRKGLGVVEGSENPVDYFAGLSEFLSATPSLLRLVNLEELVGEVQQQNLPGTTSEAPNWQRKISYSIDLLLDDPIFMKRLALWNQALARGAAR